MVTPYIGLKPKVMIILNNANGSDAKSGIFMNKGYEDFKGRIANTLGLRMGDLYVTGVMKRAKGRMSSTPRMKRKCLSKVCVVKSRS
jgi:DNA polymerase-3 subunit alpha